MRTMRIVLFFVLLFMGSVLKGQQDCSLQVKGQIYSRDGRPLQGVIIFNEANNQREVSDEHGGFQLSRVCVGDLALQFRHIGYSPVVFKYNLSKDTLISVTLDVSAIHIKDVEIMGVQSSSLSLHNHRLSRTQKMESSGENLANALSRIAGVSTLSTGAGIVKPVINGMHSNRILILNNGVRQQGQQWGVEHSPEIDPFLADRLEVIKGAQGVRYGADALGGVVVATASEINSDKRIGGRVDLTGQSNGRGGAIHSRLEGGVAGVDGLGWRLQATSKMLGNYKTAGYYLGNTGVKELNYAGTLVYKRSRNTFEGYYSHFGTELGIFQGAHVSTIEDIQARIENGQPFESYDFSYKIDVPKQVVTHDLGKLSWKHKFNSGGVLSAVYGFQQNHRQEFDMRRVESNDLPMADMTLTTQDLDLMIQTVNSSLGIQASLQVNNNTPGTGTTPIIPNYDSFSLGVFGVHQFHIGRLHAEVGARYDYKDLDVAGFRYRRDGGSAGGLEQYLLTDAKTFHNVSGSLGILYHLSEQLHWKSNLGLAWRAPSVNELYSDGVHHGSASYEVGDRDLKSEKGLKWINTLLWQSERFGVTFDVYGQLLRDYIYAQPDPDSVRQTIRGTFPLFSYQQHDAVFYGADLQLNYEITDFLGYDLSASMVRAKNTDLDQYLPYIPADRISNSIRWRYTVDQNEGSYIKLSHRFVARQLRFEEHSDYTPPPAGYHLFDLVFAKELSFGSAQILNIMVSGENLMNTSYKDYMDRFRYFAHQKGRSVNVKISYQF